MERAKHRLGDDYTATENGRKTKHEVKVIQPLGPNYLKKCTEADPPAASTAGIKRKHNSPWPFIRWVYLARWIFARLSWWRKWAIRDRLSYLRQFNPDDIYYFAEDGMESWFEV